MDTLTYLKACFPDGLNRDDPGCMFIAHLPFPILQMNRDGTILFSNEAFSHLTGYELDEIVEKKWWDFFTFVPPPENSEKQTWICREENNGNCLVSFLTKDNREKILAWQSMEITNNEGEVQTIVGFGIEIPPVPERLVSLPRQTQITRELRKERERFSTLVETVPVGIVIFDLEGNITFTNQMAEEILQQQKDEIAEARSGLLRKSPTGKWVQIVDCSGEPVPLEENVVYKVATTGVTLTNVCRGIVDKTGNIRYYNVSGALIDDSTSTGKEVIVTFQDITDHLQWEKNMRDSEEKFRLLSESTSQGIILHDGSHILFANKVLSDMFGYSPEELENNFHINWLFTPETYPNVQLHVDARSEEKYEADCVRKDGSVFPVAIRGRSIKYKNKYTRISTITDLTEVRKSEESLRHERDLLNKIMETSPTGIMIIDAGGNITYANREAEEKLGLTREEITSRTFNSPEWTITDCQGESIPDEELGFSLAVRDRKTIYDYCEIIISPDGKKVILSFNIAPIFDPGNNLEMVVATFEDITEKTQFQEKTRELNLQLQERAKDLARSNADLQQFAFIASHDLKEPLNIILGYARLLETRYAEKNDPQFSEFISFIIDDSIRMQNLINGLLQLSRVTTRGNPLVPVDANIALKYALIALENKIETHRAQVTADVLPEVIADEVQLSSVFQNLIDNAIKYKKLDVDPIIHISVKKDGEKYIFSVADNGIGIDPKYFERIFLIFQSPHKDTQYSGSGIGLAICKKIITRHRGDIWVESQIGVGSTFYFTLQGVQ